MYQINQCPPKRCSNEVLRRRFGSRSPRQGLNGRFFPFRERRPSSVECRMPCRVCLCTAGPGHGGATER